MMTRQPAVAGTFYSSNAEALNHQLDEWLAPTTDDIAPLRAIVVPHAGYRFSGHIAAMAYRYVKQQSQRIKRILLVGPCHRYAFEGCAIPQHHFFASPCGTIKVDRKSLLALSQHDDVRVSDQAHAKEHSLEVQLPFIQHCCSSDVELIPIVTSRIAPGEVATLLDTLWNDETLLIASSDLSHFHPYDEAKRRDIETCRLIESFAATITPQQACGSTAINSLLLLAKQRQYHLTKLASINSGDSAGDKQRVVGYASYLVTESQ